MRGKERMKKERKKPRKKERKKEERDEPNGNSAFAFLNREKKIWVYILHHNS